VHLLLYDLIYSSEVVWAETTLSIQVIAYLVLHLSEVPHLLLRRMLLYVPLSNFFCQILMLAIAHRVPFIRTAHFWNKIKYIIN
jgi:hypothetical protein